MSFKMYLTDKDREVLKFVETYDSITIEICRKIFYNTQKSGSEIARRRLSKLVSYNKLKVTRDNLSNQNVYYTTKKLSYVDASSEFSCPCNPCSCLLLKSGVHNYFSKT